MAEIGWCIVEAFEQTSLWRRTLGERKQDVHKEPRRILRDAYLNMRRRAADLVSLIPQDCPGLTVHDITHLDALWEMADLIVGEKFEINPAEAFVFGASVLLHDAAMSVAAFPGGKAEILATPEWSDALFSTLSRRLGRAPTDEELAAPLGEIYSQVMFNALRALHARYAEKLLTARWTVPSTGDDVCLLENQDLRHSYGEIIGRIAHSHHWDINRLSSELRAKVGVEVALPGEWTLNEIKIACILRCADAAHIDQRRAPLMLYALTHPVSVSGLHWNFQNRLLKTTIEADKLLYASSRDFSPSEASAWWLCYDSIKMIDKEVSASNATLQQIDSDVLRVTGVIGAQSPTYLAKYVRTTGWRPVNAEIRVSDPIQLAQTLGGRHLYGAGAYAPIRELLQNAVDAVRRRRVLEVRGDKWGLVRIVLEQDSGGSAWLHVDDTGIGMSERIISEALLDFGKSYWNSSLLMEDYPDLSGKRVQSIGKFGIGFFSVFLLGNNVRVISRPCTAAAADVRILEFSQLGNRPVVKEGRSGDIPQDISTRVSVKLNEVEFDDWNEDEDFDFEILRNRGARGLRRRISIGDILKTSVVQMMASLDIDFVIDDRVNNYSHRHESDWKHAAPEKFLGELLANIDESSREINIPLYAGLLSSIADGEEFYGRAALSLGFGRDGSLGRVSVGGFTYSGRSSFPYVGIVKGDTDRVDRSIASAEVPPKIIADWATGQAQLIDKSQFDLPQLLAASARIIGLGGNPGDLPFCYLGGKIISYDQFLGDSRKIEEFFIPISKKTYSEDFDMIGLNRIGAGYFAEEILENVLMFNWSDETNIFSKAARRGAKEVDYDVGDDVTEVLKTIGSGAPLRVLRQLWRGFKLTLGRERIRPPRRFSPDGKTNIIRVSRAYE